MAVKFSSGMRSTLRLLIMFGLLSLFLHYERVGFQKQLEELIEKHEGEKQVLGTLHSEAKAEVEVHKARAEKHKKTADYHRRVAEDHKSTVDLHRTEAETHKLAAEQHKAAADVHKMDNQAKQSELKVLKAKLDMQNEVLQEQLKTCREELTVEKKKTGNQAPAIEEKSDADAAGKNCLQKVTESFFCTPDVSDNKRWRKIRGTLEVSKMGGADRGNYQVPKPPHWYCDKLKSSLRPYVKPKTTVDDLAVAIFAGEQLYYGQVAAQRDTWLSRVPAHYIFASTPDPRIPVHGLKEKYGLKPDYEDQLVTQFTNLFALKELYLKEPNRKWYFNYGCDNYINLDYMLEMLDQYDSNEDVWIGNYAVEEQVPDWIDLKDFPKNKGNKKYKEQGYEWVLGSTSWIMSNSVAKAFAENVEEFLEKYELKKDYGQKKICYCPDRLAGLILSLLGFKVNVLKHKDSTRWCSYNSDSISMGDLSHDSGENIVMHFISPRKQYAADQRATHETLDRMINAGDPNQIVSRFREFIDHHFSVLRRRQSEVKFLALEAGKHSRPIKPNYGSPSPWNQYDDIPLDPSVEDKKMPY